MASDSPPNSPPSVEETFASAAESVKNTLISALISGKHSSFVQISEITNSAFESLTSLHADHRHLSVAVDNFVRSQRKLNHARTDLEHDREFIRSSLSSAVSLELQLEEMNRLRTEASRAEDHVNDLGNQITEARNLLKDLLARHRRADRKAGRVIREADEAEKSREDVVSRLEDFYAKVEEKRRNEGNIRSRIDDATAEFELAKSKLSSLGN